MDVAGKTIVVTGGTRGLGAGIVAALTKRSARVITVARNPPGSGPPPHPDLVEWVRGDITDAELAWAVVSNRRPDVIILNAGTIPSMVPIDTVDWESFTRPWETDVKGALIWMQASLNSPLRPGSKVIAVSSGAAVSGSPLSGGYAGAKRMVWLMSNYANGLASDRGLDIIFQTVVPLQMIGNTGVGDAASRTYSARMGIDPASFLARFGRPLSPNEYGEYVADILADSDQAVRAYGVKGDTGIMVLDPEPA